MHCLAPSLRCACDAIEPASNAMYVACDAVSPELLGVRLLRMSEPDIVDCGGSMERLERLRVEQAKNLYHVVLEEQASTQPFFPFQP